MKTGSTDIEKRLKELKPFLAKEYHVERIGYFGSFALGTEGDDSDIDIVIDLKEPLGWDFVNLKLFLEKELNRPVDIVTRKALKKQLKNKILSQTRFV